MSGNIEFMKRILATAASAGLAPSSRVYESGEFLFRQGFPTDGIRFLTSGLFKSSIIAENGVEVLVALLGPGECLGDVEYFLGNRGLAGGGATGSPAICSVVALERSSILVFSSDELSRLKRAYPDLDFMLGRSLASRLAENAERFERSFGYSLEYNVLVAALSRLGAEARPVRKTELLEYLGVSARHLNRVLSDLVAQGLVRVEDGAVLVVDAEAARGALVRKENS
jgi:CRP-like cAMP-binding protein